MIRAGVNEEGNLILADESGNRLFLGNPEAETAFRFAVFGASLLDWCLVDSPGVEGQVTLTRPDPESIHHIAANCGLIAPDMPAEMPVSAVAIMRALSLVVDGPVEDDDDSEN